MVNILSNIEGIKAMNSFATSKRIYRFLMGMVLEFNHFILYNYHIRNYTLMSNLILSTMQLLDDQKGLFIDQNIYPNLGLSPQIILENYASQNNFPFNIDNIFTDITHRPNGLLLDVYDFGFLNLPVTLLSCLIGYLLFCLSFNFRISLLFRQYSFFGFVWLALFDGKM